MYASRSVLLPANAAGGCGPGGGNVASRLCVVDEVSAGDGKVLVAAGVRETLVAAVASFPTKREVKEIAEGKEEQREAKEDDKSTHEASSKLAVPETLADTISLQVGASLRSEVMSVAKCGRVVAAADGLGSGVLARLPNVIDDISDLVPEPMSRRTGGDEAAEPSAKRMRVDIGGCLKWDPIMPHAMPGWSGVAFPRLAADQAQDPELVAVTHSFAQETQIVDVFTGARRGRISHAQTPTGVAFADSNTLLTLEWGTVSLWDVRTSKPVKSTAGSMAQERQPWLALDVGQDPNVLAIAGESRAVVLLDLRSWRTLATWRAPIKYEPVALRLVGADNRCFIAGRDHELVGCRLADMSKKSAVTTQSAKTQTPQSVPAGSLLYQNHRTFRSEDTWAGIDICSGASDSESSSSRFVGLTTSGILYAGNYGF
ncbi:Hypothetical Protein FCC1311_024042 [Hondaea fermentalgiana]|uniref:Uncharacterized protein n=1 Tax=Hondaea fermentalgiana TaxID=2315210 RepID=A0A2R5GC83_9STRA|nr:Hypothetical Protein FCC1311_024042 [Hondaea fermentalgiana]|eukprot:GBG26183.1 Hypothetical Protein FCC1311_024042 [Hondaea fermentalgiana]